MAYEHLIDKDRCKGCDVCVAVCPKNVLEISTEMNKSEHNLKTLPQTVAVFLKLPDYVRSERKNVKIWAGHPWPVINRDLDPIVRQPAA